MWIKDALLLFISPVTDILQWIKEYIRTRVGTVHKMMQLEKNNSNKRSTWFLSSKHLVLTTPVSSSFSSLTLENWNLNSLSNLLSTNKKLLVFQLHHHLLAAYSAKVPSQTPPRTKERLRKNKNKQTKSFEHEQRSIQTKLVSSTKPAGYYLNMPIALFSSWLHMFSISEIDKKKNKKKCRNCIALCLHRQDNHATRGFLPFAFFPFTALS